MVRIGPKLNRKQQIERKLICKEMSEAMMKADVKYIARRYMTLRMETVFDRFYDWATRAYSELG